MNETQNKKETQISKKVNCKVIKNELPKIER